MHYPDESHPTGVGDTSPRGGSAVARARQRKSNAAVQMKLAGATWTEIATTLGFPTPRAALLATERALEKQLTSAGDRAQMRALAGARLERLLRSVWPKAVDPESPEQMIAVTNSREIVADHRKLFGLDAPTEIVVHNPTQTELESWVAQVVALSSQIPDEPDIIEGEWLEEGEDDAVQAQ